MRRPTGIVDRESTYDVGRESHVVAGGIGNASDDVNESFARAHTIDAARRLTRNFWRESTTHLRLEAKNETRRCGEVRRFSGWWITRAGLPKANGRDKDQDKAPTG